MKNRFSNYIFVMGVPAIISILMGIIFEISDYLIVFLMVLLYGVFSYYFLDTEKMKKIEYSKQKITKRVILSVFLMILSGGILLSTKIIHISNFNRNILMIIQIVMAFVFSISTMSLYLNIRRMVQKFNC